METGISIGTRAESIEALSCAIMNILGSGQEQGTLVAALEALTNGVSVNHATLSNCHVIGDTITPQTEEDDDANRNT